MRLLLDTHAFIFLVIWLRQVRQVCLPPLSQRDDNSISHSARQKVS